MGNRITKVLVANRGEIAARIARLAAALQMEDFLDRSTEGFSQGQRTKTAIARALVVDPALVIADEPTANLDSENSRMVVDLMREMNREHKVTFVFTTHDPRLLDHVDRKILLTDGSIERDEPMETLEAA